MDDLVGVGILGAGWITRAHVLAIRTLPLVAPVGRPVGVVMLAARDRERAAAMAANEIDRVTTDWREVVEDPSVQVVANLMGVTAHREATEAALALGKPVLCEKPLGVDRFEARSMTARRDGRRRAGRHRVQLPVRARDAPRARDRRERRPRLDRPLPGGLPPGLRRAPGAAPAPQRLARGDRLRPHRRLPALPRRRGGGGPGDGGEADRRRAGRRGRLRRGDRPARRRRRVARGVARRARLEGPPGGRARRDARGSVWWDMEDL